MSRLNQVGVVIGRFQIDELHEGHLSLLNYVKERHRNMIIMLGVRPSPSTQKNPLSYHLRESMIKPLYPYATILPIVDCGSDRVWSQNVDAAIKAVFPGFDAVIYGGPDNSLDAYSGNFQTKTVDTSVNTEHATLRRARIALEPLQTSDFRAGVIYALQTLAHRTFVSVDIAALYRHRGVLKVALGRKQNESRYRLPGGFVSPKDENFSVTAKRELYEEMGLHIKGLTPISDFLSDDWRSADQDDVTHRTILFYGWIEELPFSIEAGDDLLEAEWFSLKEIQENPDLIVPEHRELLQALFARLDVENIKLEIVS